MRYDDESSTSWKLIPSFVTASQALLAIDPEVSFSTPHYDGHALILVRLASARRAVFTDVFCEAYVAVAPKKMVALLATKK